MNKLVNARVIALLSLLIVFFASSCVNEKYDMSDDNLNLEITPFEEGVTLPLGSTEEIKLKDLLKDVDSSILNCVNGAYAVSIKDSLDMNEELSELTELIDIPDVDFSQDIKFELNDVDVSDVKLDADDYTFGHELSTSVTVPEVELPVKPTLFEIEAGTYNYIPENADIDFAKSNKEKNVIKLKDNIQSGIPESERNDVKIDIENSPYANLWTVSKEFKDGEEYTLKITLAKGVASVDDIILDKNAGLKVDVSLDKAFLLEGELKPDFDMDFSSLLSLKEHSDGKFNLKDDLAISHKNNFKASKVYGISSLNVSKDDWKLVDGVMCLEKTFEVTYDGTIILNNLKTTTNLLTKPENSVMKLHFDVEFVNMDIADIKITLDPIDISKSENVEVKMTELALPEEIEKISYAEFTDDSGVDIVVKMQNADKFAGLTTTLNTLKVNFPKEFVVEGADADNNVIIKNVNLAQGVQKHVHVNRVNLPAPLDGKINFDNVISVVAEATAVGSVQTSSLPVDAAGDMKVVVDVVSDFKMGDYEVTMLPYNYDLEIEGQEIVVEIPENLADLDEITIYPEGEPEITIDMNFPEMPLDIMPSSGEGMMISFPKMLRFKEQDLPAVYNFDPVNNSVTFKGDKEIPEQIVLPIEKLVVVPEKDPVDNQYYSKGSVEIEGGITLAGGELSKDEIEDITSSGKKVTVVAHIPEIVPSVVDLDKYESTISQKVAVELLSEENVPEQLVSLEMIEMEGANINLALDASTLPELGSASLSVDLAINFPEMIKVEGTDDNGNLKLTGNLGSDNKIEFPAINVRYLDLAGVDIQKGISDTLVVDGTITLSDAALDIDEWLKDELRLKLEAGLSDVTIKKLKGKVDYSLEPVVQEIDLGDLTGSLGDMGMEANFDFNHAHLALEIETNLGVPMEAHMELIPYYNGQAGENTVKADLVLEPSQSADVTKVTKFWLAEKTSSRCPEGYELVEVENLLSLFKNIPEKLEVKLTGGTDSDKDCVLEPSEPYILNVDYLFELPLEFGEEFEVTYRDTIANLPAIVGSLLAKGNRVMLAGDISNALPLALDLRLNFLDSEGKVVPSAEGCGVQKIAACNLDGSASKTDLEIVIALKEGVDVSDITSVELLFNANSGGVTGVPVTEDAFLQANLKVVLPEGITIDLNDIMNSDEQ